MRAIIKAEKEELRKQREIEEEYRRMREEEDRR